MFRPTVDIITFYPKLYAKGGCLYNVRHRVSVLRSHHHPYQAIPLSPRDHSCDYQSPHLGHKEKE